MHVYHALDRLPVSIALLGPTPRSPDVPSWRPEALEILRRLEFSGNVFVPEAADWAAHTNYDAQVFWEWMMLEQATVHVCWVPRDLVTMPGFTTNIEFGHVVTSGRTILGYPEGAPKMNYLDAMAREYNVPIFHTLEDVLTAAVAKAGNRLDRSTRHADAD